MPKVEFLAHYYYTRDRAERFLFKVNGPDDRPIGISSTLSREFINACGGMRAAWTQLYREVRVSANRAIDFQGKAERMIYAKEGK